MMRSFFALCLLVIACVSAKAQNSNDIERYVEWIDISGLAPGYRACYIFESEKYLSFRVRDEVYYHRFYISAPQKQRVHDIIYRNTDIQSKRQQVMDILRFAISRLMDETIVDGSAADRPAEGQTIHDYIAKSYHNGSSVSFHDFFTMQDNAAAEAKRMQSQKESNYDNGATGDLLDNLTVTPQALDDYIQEHPESDVAREYMDDNEYQDSPDDYPEAGSVGYGSYGIQKTPDYQNVEGRQAADSPSENFNIGSAISNLFGNIEGYAETIITLLLIFFILKAGLKAVFSGDRKKKGDTDKSYEDMSWFHDNHKEM